MAEAEFYKGHGGAAKPSGSDNKSWFQMRCGHCGNDISGAVLSLYEDSSRTVRWIWCPVCAEPSVQDTLGRIYPGAIAGFPVEGLPDEVDAAYREARDCLSVNAFTATELICRKILMHVAVDKGAAEGKQFAYYVDHLEAAGYITPPMKDWVDLIRQHGNESTHRLSAPDQLRAEGTLMFTGEMLRIVYEMAHKAAQYTKAPATANGGTP